MEGIALIALSLEEKMKISKEHFSITTKIPTVEPFTDSAKQLLI